MRIMFHFVENTEKIDGKGKAGLESEGTCNNVDDNYEEKSTKDLENDEDCDNHSLGSWKESDIAETSTSVLPSWPAVVKTASPRMSWADMTQEDELEDEEDEEEEQKEPSRKASDVSLMKTPEKPTLSREQRQDLRLMHVKRKKDFICLERIKGKLVNVGDGLELHTSVFSAVEQKRIVDQVYLLEEKGRKGQLRGSFVFRSKIALILNYVLFSNLNLFLFCLCRAYIYCSTKVDERQRTCDYSIWLLLQLRSSK